MRIVDLFEQDAAHGEVITRFDSRDAVSRLLGSGHGDAHVYCIELGPNGQIGRHPTGFTQIFVALRGSGWVSGADGITQELRPGQAAFFEFGEVHAKGSLADGMLALMIQLPASRP